MSAPITGILIKQAPLPTDGEYDFALYQIRDGHEAVIAETFGRIGESATSDARALAHQFAASGEVMEACRAISEYDWQVVEPNGADIPDHLDAFIAELQGFATLAQEAARAALSKAQGES